MDPRRRDRRRGARGVARRELLLLAASQPAQQQGAADPLAAFEAYRRGGGRSATLAIGGICAPREDEARAARAEYSPEVPMSFCGSPERCASQIGELADRLRISEVVILDHWPFMNRSPERQVEDRARTLELLAGVLL